MFCFLDWPLYMRVGIVNFLNTRPLDYGIRSQSCDLVEAPPPVLAKLLLEGALDCALISSVECLRYSDSLSYCDTVGVCAQNKVRSVIYIKKAMHKAHGRAGRIRRLYADRSSRTSLALWQCLYYAGQETKTMESKIVFQEAKEIPSAMNALEEEESGGLLIGDAALEFQENAMSKSFCIYDMAEWWHETEALPFVFALWAYPRRKVIENSFFENSLADGLAHLNDIIRLSPFRDSASYLRKLIHYEMREPEKKALERFQERLRAANLLEDSALLVPKQC